MSKTGCIRGQPPNCKRKISSHVLFCTDVRWTPWETYKDRRHSNNTCIVFRVSSSHRFYFTSVMSTFHVCCRQRLLSCSCHGIQQLVDICLKYDKKWDMTFNSCKTQCITFGGNNPVSLHLTMNHVKLEWGNALKYLRCLFQVNSCRVDVTTDS